MEGGGEVGVEREARVKEGGGECGQRGQSEGERWWVWSEARLREVRPEREREEGKVGMVREAQPLPMYSIHSGLS